MKCAVIRFPGTSGDRDCYYVLKNVLGESCDFVFHKESFSPEVFDLIVLPGGAAYGDYLRPGALAATSKVLDSIKKAANLGKIILGIGNGFQILLEAGLLPGAILHNRQLKFHSDDVFVRIENNDTPFTNLFKTGEVLKLPLACGKGNYFADEKTIEGILARSGAVFTYCDKDGNVIEEINPTGAVKNIAGIVNKQGNVLGMIPHPERCAEEIFNNTDGRQIFESIIQYVKGGMAHGR